MPDAPSSSSALGARWILPDPPSNEAHALAAALEQPLWFTQVLVSRGIGTPAEARRFLVPSMDGLHDPDLLLGMQDAVARILHAIRLREPVLIYGDYDVDGTTATVLLKTAIDRITPLGETSLVRYHIPHRIREGYGMQSAVLEGAAKSGVRLVISVDTGIRAFAAAADAKRLGLDLIVTDHHLPDGAAGVPEAVAVINPNQPGCEYPYKQLCGAAVAFKLAHALLRAAGRGPDTSGVRAVDPVSLADKLLPSLLKLVAIATVADAVPLTGENRVLVALGLKALRDPRQTGLRALMALAGVAPDEERGPSATDVAFRLAPRINAAGRMDVASDVVRLLLSRDGAEAQVLAGKLHALNDDRRKAEAEVLTALEDRLKSLQGHDTLLAAGCLVLDGEGWHRGVIGILASRVVEKTGLPALVVAHEDGLAHGSGRSIGGFHLLDALSAVHAEDSAPLFDRFGGHAHAVGFSLPSERVPLLRSRLSIYASERLTAADLQQRVEIDAELPLQDWDSDLLRRLRLLEPFGQGNREPVFLARGCKVVGDVRVLKERHAKLMLQSGTSAPVEALAWSRGISWPERLSGMGISAGAVIDVSYRIRENRHPQFGGTGVEVCDIQFGTAAPSQDRATSSS